MKKKYYKILFPTFAVIISISMMFIFSGITSNASLDSANSNTSINAGSENPIALYITSATQGEFPGTSTLFEGAIDVFGLSHEVLSPIDTTTGQASGKRQHKPITISKSVDKTSPMILQALINGEILPTVKFEFYHLDAAGTLSNYYTIKLDNARIVSVSTYQPDSSHEPREQVSFVYQKITWTHTEGGTETSDDWSTP